MTITNKVVQDALAARIAEITAVADANKQEQKEVEAIHGWQALPADLTDEQMALAVVVIQSDPQFAMTMNQDVLKALGDKLNDIAAKDEARMNAIMQKAEAFTKKPRVEPGISLQVVTQKTGNTWTVVAALVKVDEKLNVALADKMDGDLYMSVFVTPHQNRSLTGTFNVPVHYTMQGATVEPVVLTHNFAEGRNMIHVKGHLSRNGQVHPIVMAVPYDNVAPAPNSAPQP